MINNRIAMAPIAIAGLVNSDGILTQRAIDYYVAAMQNGTMRKLRGPG